MMSQRSPFFAAALVVIVLSSSASGDDLRVKDLPIPEGAADISYMKRRGDIRFQAASDVKETGDWYAKQLAAQRWTKSGKDNLQKSFWVQKFARDKALLEVRVDRREKGSEVRLTPTGVLWDEDLAPHAKDLPLTADAKDMKYEDFFERIEFTSPSSVDTIAEFLSASLEKRGWAKSGRDQVTEKTASLERTHGQSSVTISIRAGDAGSNVTIRTKGMNWDGIKQANELAKKSAPKVVAGAASKMKPEEESAPPPKRKDKPKQGIANLPKLPNEGTVTMDGKTYKLTSIIAYEVFSRGKWSTKILATEKPIKQEALLARLKKSGHGDDQSAQPGEGMGLPQTYLQFDLDEDDRPERMSLRADNIPGSGSSGALTGTALVEDGRARGTIKQKEPDKFFDKAYTAEISFDVPVLTRDSTPAKRLTGIPKLANSGTLTLGNKTYQLLNSVAYEMKRLDEPVTAIVISEKPLNMNNLRAALGKKSIDDYFEFIPQLKLIIDSSDNVSAMSIWADNASISGTSEAAGDIVIEDGRARGTVTMQKPGDFFGKKYTFAVSFDVDVLKGSSAPKPDASAGGLVADSYQGFPIPDGRQNISSEGSKFRKVINATVPAELDAVVRFYRHELASGGWKEDSQAAKVEQRAGKLAFNSPTGSLIVQLKAANNETSITLISRDPQAAKAAGLLPASGKARLLIGNQSEKPATVTINKQDYDVAAGAGAKDPTTGLNWDLAPGKYTVEVKLKGGKAQTEELTISTDETWGVVLIEGKGFLAMQLY